MKPITPSGLTSPDLYFFVEMAIRELKRLTAQQEWIDTPSLVALKELHDLILPAIKQQTHNPGGGDN